MKHKLEKILSLLSEAEREAELYRNTQSFKYLSQACEKPWVAFTLMLELKSGEEITKGATRRPIAFRLGYEHLYTLCNSLHISHYEGSPAIIDEDILADIARAIQWIREEVAA